LLGSFRIATADGEPMALSRSAQRLVAFLALTSPAPRERVAAALWPEVAETRAHANLRNVIWRLHRQDGGLLTLAGHHLSLADGIAVDVRDIFRPDVVGNEGVGVSLAATPLERELLPGWVDDWVVVSRERLRQIILHRADAQAERLLAAGDFGAALQSALAAAAVEPLRESTHRLIVRAHLAEGNASEALRHYEWLARLLWDELGVRPSRQLRGLIDSMRTAVPPIFLLRTDR
jgi:DNA-binding SARP family transcriptional activator